MGNEFNCMTPCRSPASKRSIVNDEKLEIEQPIYCDPRIGEDNDTVKQ